MRKKLLLPFLFVLCILLPGISLAQAIAAGSFHCLSLCSDNTAKSWGLNAKGQLGNGSFSSSPTPVQVNNLTNIQAIAAGYSYSLFIKNDGTVWGCGFNFEGQLGDGTSTNRSNPVQVGALTGIVAAAGGSHHSLFVRNNGTVSVCGRGFYGELGTGTYNDWYFSPVQIPSLSGIIAASCGPNHSLFVKNDGSALACGYNLYGQLGTGNTLDRHTPTLVALTGIAAAAAGNDYSLFLKNDGTVWACGVNNYGQLGDGTTTNRTTPVLLSTLTGVIAIAVFDSHSLFLKNDGTVWACGRNNLGQLGDGTTIDRPTPVQVNGLSGITAIDAGNTHSIFLKNDCSVWVCGNNTFGQLANGTFTGSTSVPTQVTGTCQALNSLITAGGPTAICASGSVTLNAVAGSGYFYQWRLNSAPIPGATSASYVAAAIGNYDCIISGSCGSDTSNIITVSINPLPSSGYVTANGPTFFCTGGSVTLSASTGSGLTYQWRVNGNNIPGATSVTYLATSTGLYDCVVSNACGSTTLNPLAVIVNDPPAPVITAAGPTNFCAGGSVQLDINQCSNCSYSWRKNGVHVFSGIWYTATTSGNYDCVVSNWCSTATSNTITVTVNSGAVTTITASGPTTFCAPASVTLNANPSSGLTYQWKRNTLNISGATLSSYPATTTGTYTCVASNGTCTATSNAIVVTVNPLPSASITASGSTILCSPGSVTLNANTGAGLSYQWRLNSGTIAGATLSSYSATATGNYDCIVTNSCGNTTSNIITVTVNSIPTAAITASGPTTFCDISSVTLIANTGPGLTYQWRVNGVNITGATANAYIVTAISGNFDCVVSNTCGSSTSNVITVTVNPSPTASITAAGSTTVCSPNTVTLNANTGSGLSYQWRLNSINISGATSSSYPASTTGSYSCLVSNSCGSATSNSINVTVNTVPSTPGIITGQTAGVCSSTKTYSIASVSGATGYTWTAPAGASISSGQGTVSVNITFTSSFSSGSVSVVATNSCGASGSSSLAVTAVPAQPGNITGPVSVCHNQNNVLYSIAAVPGATSYTWTVPSGTQIKNGQGTVQIRVRFGNSAGNITVRANNSCGQSPVRTLAIAMPCREGEEFSSDNFDVTLYPNPASHKLSVVCNTLTGNESLALFNAVGEMIYKSNIINHQYELDVHMLPDGVYFVEIISAEEKRVLKFIKQK